MSSRQQRPPRATSVRTPRGIGIRHDKAYYKRKLSEANDANRILRIRYTCLMADLEAQRNAYEQAMNRYMEREKELCAEINRLHVRPTVDSDTVSSAAHNATMASFYESGNYTFSTDTDHSTDQEEEDVILTKISERISSDANTSQRIHSFPGGNSNARFGGPCAICLETPQDPVSLNCDHCFCRGCVIKWFSTTSSHHHSRSEFKCPTCRTD